MGQVADKEHTPVSSAYVMGNTPESKSNKRTPGTLQMRDHVEGDEVEEIRGGYETGKDNPDTIKAVMFSRRRIQVLP